MSKKKIAELHIFNRSTVNVYVITEMKGLKDESKEPQAILVIGITLTCVWFTAYNDKNVVVPASSRAHHVCLSVGSKLTLKRRQVCLYTCKTW